MSLTTFFSHAFHVRPEQVKHTPFVKPGQEAEVADGMNTVLSGVTAAALTAFPAVADTALFIHPNQLKGVSQITDHTAAADFLNNHIQGMIATQAAQAPVPK